MRFRPPAARLLGASSISFTQPADLRRQLAAVPPGTAITITYKRQEDGRKKFEVTAR